MISIETIGEKLSLRLNNNSYGYDFKVFTDTGKYKKAEREYNRVNEAINCLLTVGPTDLTNLTDGNIIATQNYRLELLLRLENFEENIQDEGVELPGQKDVVREIIDGNIERINKLRNIFTNVSQQNYQELLTDNEGKSFNVTTVYQFLQSGNREQRPGVGNSLAFSMNIYAMFIENGLNTQDREYYLDGNRIPFQANTVYQIPTLDGYVYADTTDARTRVLASQTSLSWNFELPALNNEVTKVIIDFIFGRKLNEAHVLTIETKGQDGVDAYFTALGESRQMGETIKNIGQSITLFETVNDYELVTIPDKYYVYRNVSETVNLVGSCYCIDNGKLYKGGEASINNNSYILCLVEQSDVNLRLVRSGINGEQ